MSGPWTITVCRNCDRRVHADNTGHAVYCRAPNVLNVEAVKVVAAEAEPAAPWLLPEHIVGVGDICRLAGIQRGTLLAWRRDRGFPKPIAKLAREEVWDLRAVKDWMRRR